MFPPVPKNQSLLCGDHGPERNWLCREIAASTKAGAGGPTSGGSLHRTLSSLFPSYVLPFLPPMSTTPG